MEKSKKVKFRFVRDGGYRFVPVNGVWGGVTPRGDITADFFHEALTCPESVTYAVTEADGLGAEVERQLDDPSSQVTRSLMFGIVLIPEHAESIGQWLIDKARESQAMKLTAQRKKKVRDLEVGVGKEYEPTKH